MRSPARRPVSATTRASRSNAVRARSAASTRDIRILDLPGTYSLAGETPDELVVARVLEGRIPGEAIPDGLVVVADATTLQRGLGLVREVLRLGFPTLHGRHHDRRSQGPRRPSRPDRAVAHPRHPRRWAWWDIAASGVEQLPYAACSIRKPGPRPPSLPPAETPEERFAWVDDTCRAIGAGRLAPDTRTDRIDRVLLHPLVGVAVFGLVMLLLFQSIFAWAVPAMDTIDGAFRALAGSSHAVLPASWLTDLWADGILAGVGAVLIFLPQILILFTFLHLLNDVGYMARAAFVVDRVMGRVGPAGTQLRAAALVLRLRRARHHGRAHDRLAARAPRHHPGGAVHDLLGAPPGLHAPHRRVRAGHGAARPARRPGPHHVRPLPARARAPRWRRRRCSTRPCSAARCRCSTWSCRRIAWPTARLLRAPGLGQREGVPQARRARSSWPSR